MKPVSNFLTFFGEIFRSGTKRHDHVMQSMCWKKSYEFMLFAAGQWLSGIRPIAWVYPVVEFDSHHIVILSISIFSTYPYLFLAQDETER